MLHREVMRAPANVEVLHEWTATGLRRVLQAADDAHTRRGATYGWRASYLIEAALIGYEATGDERLIVTARDAMLSMLDHRDDRYGWSDDVRGRVLRAWGSSHIDAGVFQNIITHAGRIAAPMAWYAWLVQQAGLGGGHQAAAGELANAAAAAMREFDDERVVDDKLAYYWRITHDKMDALNHQTSAGEALLYLASLYRDGFWLDRAGKLAAYVRAIMLREPNGTLVWRYCATPDAPDDSPPEPIWKSQVTIRFLRHAARLGIEFTGDDVAEVARSFRVNVLDPPDYNALFAERRRRLKPGHRYGGPNNITPHLLLGEYDTQLARQITDAVAGDPQVGGWLAHPKTGSAYALRLGVTV
jgi:hypothetical protein